MARILKQQSKVKRNALYVFIWLLGMYIVFVAFRTLRQSILLDSLDRVNVVYYGENVELFSFGIKDDVNYIVSFSHVDKVSVPGGYGRYNVGALGKLAQIEKDHPLIGRTFSSMVSAHVDYYVMPQNPDVYDGKGTDDPQFEQGQLISQLFSSSYSTNANFFDKLYISYLMSKHRQNDFAPLRSISEIVSGKEENFSERRFLKKYKGFFYHQSLREEGEQVKVLYDSYSSAVTLSRVIEGQGIRVADLTESDVAKQVVGCRVEYRDNDRSKTVHYLQRTFGCTVQQGTTEGADITLTVGAGLAERWK
ncbi:hypothetical protein KBC70_02970 [Candidatus Woesebacteria bacterium]|nr:hypothetical protein [Candidatus Woesebacteria bacterium]